LDPDPLARGKYPGMYVSLFVIEAYVINTEQHVPISLDLSFPIRCQIRIHMYACISITRASGRGLGPGILEFFGPQMALAYRLDDISQGPKQSLRMRSTRVARTSYCQCQSRNSPGFNPNILQHGGSSAECSTKNPGLKSYKKNLSV
jgi:hypothetical protein